MAMPEFKSMLPPMPDFTPDPPAPTSVMEAIAQSLREGDTTKLAKIPPQVSYTQLRWRPPAPRKERAEYSPELAELFCREIASGRMAQRIYIEEVWGPTPATIMRWIKTHPEFAEAYEAAKMIRGETLAMEILDISYSTLSAEDKKIIIDAHKWLAARFNREFRDKQIVEQSVQASVTTNMVSQVDVSDMETDELLALEKAFTKMLDLKAHEEPRR